MDFMPRITPLFSSVSSFHCSKVLSKSLPSSFDFLRRLSGWTDKPSLDSGFQPLYKIKLTSMFAIELLHTKKLLNSERNPSLPDNNCFKVP